MRLTAISQRPAVACALAVLAAASLPILGCGGDGGGNGEDISPALAAALSYLPKDPAFAGVVPTDPERAPLERLEKRASKLQGWKDVKRELQRQVAEDLDFDRDIRPQLGNPLVGSASMLDQNDDQDYSALQIKDPRALRRVIERSVAKGREKRLADYKGALITRDSHRARGEEPGSDFTALHRDVLVQANSQRQLEAAIDRSAGSDNLARNEKVAAELDRGGEDLLFRAVGDSGALLKASRDKDAATARKLKWIRALGEFTTSGIITSEGVRFEFEQKTDEEDLSEDDLPLANGPEPALLHDRDAPIAVGLREPDRLYSFIEGALKTTDPKQYAEYEAAIRQLGALGTDIHKDVLQKIANLSLALRSERAGSFQTDLSTGAGADLRKFLEASTPFIEGALSGTGSERVEIVTKGSGDEKVWTVRQESGTPLLRYTVRDDTLVGSVGAVPLGDPVEEAALPGAEGSVAIALSGRRLASLVREIDQQSTPELQGAEGRQALRLISALGSIRVSVRSETSALTVRGELVLPPER